MRIDILATNPAKYSSNVYLIRGDNNSLDDVNTLIDSGADSYILRGLELINTGAGKKAISQIILTHNHFDHSGGILSLKEKYHSQVLGLAESPLIDRKLYHGEIVKVADVMMEVINITEHSNDSICLYEWNSKTLFSGDTPLDIKSVGGNYSAGFLEKLNRLLILGVKIIYPGHGNPIAENAQQILENTIEIVRHSIIKN